MELELRIFVEQHTVLVKSFALELEEGKPESRRWIDTRFLTRQDGEWYGYSYAWNDDQRIVRNGRLRSKSTAWTIRFLLS